MIAKCECFDPGCPCVETGKGTHLPAGHNGLVQILYRVDMDDKTGTAMCETCADDAFDTGLFSYESLILEDC